MNDFACLRCAQGKHTAHSSTPPHAALPTASVCSGFANRTVDGVLVYDPNVPAADGGYSPGGGSSGGGGASDTW